MRPTHLLPIALVTLIGACKTPCSDGECRPTTAPPGWTNGGAGHLVGNNQVCAVGFAGRGYQGSPYPGRLAEERALSELAGIFGAAVIEAQIIESDGFGNQSMEFARAVEIDEDLKAQVTAMADVETWRDEDGSGLFGEPGFTYAHACAPARIALAKLKTQRARAYATSAMNERSDPGEGSKPPEWVTGPQVERVGDRLCATAFTRRTYFVEEGLMHATEAIRGMLVGASDSHVLQLVDDVETCTEPGCKTRVRELLAAANEAISRGVVIDRVWFDRDGRGPAKEPLTTYAFGCSWPVEGLGG